MLTESGFLPKLFMIMAEPAGWFFFWEGLSLVIFESKDKLTKIQEKKIEELWKKYLSYL